MQRLVVEWLVDNTSSRPSIDSEPNHTGDVVQMAFDESLGTIEGVNPNDHVLLINFIGKFKKIPSSF
jgi:hypothetical protein